MEEISHACGLVESTLYKWTFYEKLFKDSMHPPFKIPILFCTVIKNKQTYNKLSMSEIEIRHH